MPHQGQPEAGAAGVTGSTDPITKTGFAEAGQELRHFQTRRELLRPVAPIDGNPADIVPSLMVRCRWRLMAPGGGAIAEGLPGSGHLDP